MLERRELAIVIFFIGLGLVLIGVLNIGAWPISNLIAAALGGLMALIGLIWWQLLKRR